ncbi:iron-containing alcohol dehydrogenase family protein [Rouxiella sp. Mn2063]|uniref:iron-containing alcohol dehydrogenase family protein n=1 Tax=Rouxiella sp. Mn2063 TaxID=3395262 RepID=UPI003BE955D2
MLAIKSPQSYHHQAGIRARVGEYLKPLASRICILSSPAAWAAVNPQLTQSLEEAGITWQLEYLAGECTDDAVSTLQQKVAEQDAQLIFAIGGGRVLDTAKAAGNALESIAVVNFPTQAATCAAWSPLSIIYNAEGGHVRSQGLAKMPVLVLVDSEVIAKSDARYLQAGIVDALAKWYEFRPYQRNNPDDLALDLKMMSAQRALDTYLEYGEQAVEDNRQQRVTPALVKVIDANIAFAGLANSVRDILPTPGFAHAIHNRLTHQAELHHWLHGEKVGFSLLVQSIIENHGGEPDAQLLQLLRVYASPLKLSALDGDREAAILAIAREIKFPANAAERLPFAINAEKLAQALFATEGSF